MFLSILIIFIALTGFIKERGQGSNKSIASMKDVYVALLIDLFFLALYGSILRFIAILMDRSISNYFIYLVLFIFLTKNITIHTPGFIIMHLYYESSKMSDKIKVLIRNVCHVSIIYGLALERRFEIPDLIMRPILEIVLLFLIINMITKILIFKDRSLLDKILQQQIEKITKC
jgi:hypothetical protein